MVYLMQFKYDMDSCTALVGREAVVHIDPCA